MHHLWVTLSVAPIEKAQHLLLKLLTIFLYCFSRLVGKSNMQSLHQNRVGHTLSAVGRSTSFATVFKRLSKTAT